MRTTSSSPLDNADEDEVEPLEIVPYPVPIEAHDPEVGGGSVVRLFFQPGDRGAAPDVDLADVVILENVGSRLNWTRATGRDR